ncbi:MAG: hypothetical protein K8R92_03145 [Planctomycetes bacterium]|nr:hypothetical protein [Planctomycetota bacterium]
MLQWARVTDFLLRLSHRPGELARLATQLREADVEILGMWGPVIGRASVGFHCIPERADQFRSFARDADMLVTEANAFLIKDKANGGSFVARLDSIAGAGINIEIIQSLTIDGSLAAVIWVDETDESRLMEVLSRT